MRISTVGSRVRVSAGTAAAAAAAALLVAACSSGSSATAAAPAGGAGSASAAAGGGASAAGGSASAAGGTVISTGSASGATILTDGAGRAVYLWLADTGTKSTCSGACATTWPPVTTAGAPTAAGAAKAGDLGTTTRSDSTRQVTYDGHPLYYFEGDAGPGTATGQGSSSFGAKWWLVTPAGSSVTSSVSSFSTGVSGSAAATGAANAGGGY